VDIELEVPDQAIAFVETESAPILGDETAAPVFIEQAQVVLADDQIPSPLTEVPEATSALASAIVAVAANRAVATVIDAPIVLVELPKAAVVAAVEMPITQSIADAPTFATAMAYTTPETRALAMSETPTSIESEQPSLADSQIAGTLAGDPFETPEPTSAQIAPAGNRGMPSVIEAPVAVDEILVAVDAVSPAFEVSTTKTPAIKNEDEALEFAVTIVDSAVESALLDVIAVPATVENVRPILTDTQNDAPRIAVEGLAAQVVTTNARPDVATIASEIVIPATEPFPAGTTLAEVYTDHVQRSEQLPARLQTLGPKGALPSPAVASTSSVRPSDLQVQRNRTPNRANGSIERYTQAEPFVTAVASAAKLNSIPMDRPELDYDSMARPATSGDGTYDYFMDLPSDDFAIQLIAQKSLSSTGTFASTVNLEDPLVLKTQLMKRPLYVLVLDTFNDIQLASDAKRAWMVQYDNGIEPWIRTVGSLQKTMQPIGPMD
jgi:septal ring-binding cell division protein DamX